MKQARYRFLGVLAIVSMAGVSQAQVRTWGFAKDTLQESVAQPPTVDLVNAGPALTFDSISAVALRPASPQYLQAEFNLSPFTTGSKIYQFSFVDGKTVDRSPGITVDSGATRALGNMRIESNLYPVVKSSAVHQGTAIVQGDTLAVRLVFHASAGRGTDTLVLVGLEDWTSSLAGRWPGKRPAAKGGAVYDLRGRPVEEVPRLRSGVIRLDAR